MKRRSFLRTMGTLGAGIGLAGLGGAPILAAPRVARTSSAEKLGWRLGCEAWTFRLFSLFEAIDKTAALGLHYLEAGPNPKLSQAQPNVTFDEDSPPQVRKTVKKKLADSGVQLVCYGFISYDRDITRKTFDFAKDMGVELLLSEPHENLFDSLDRLCEEYAINLAIHNHPKPTRYWNPDTVLKVCKDRSKRIGACADTGHWMRSGLNPVECLRKLEGRVLSFHLKDLNEAGMQGHDVPWGTGVCDIRGILAEAHRQGLKVPFFAEYEYHWENSLPELVQSVAYFEKVAAAERSRA